MKLPKTVRVGSLTYTVDSKEPRDEDLIGLTNTREAIIEVHPGIADELQASTFWHELFHALWFDAGLDTVDDASEEQVVDMLSARFVDLVRDNPNILKTLEQQPAKRKEVKAKGRQ